jgi:hypothetical protein
MSRLPVGVGISAMAAIVLLVAFGRGANAESVSLVQSRMVDRTFACNPLYGEADLVVSPRGSQEVQGARFVSAGYARLSSGSGIDPRSDLAAFARPGLRTAGARFPAAVYVNVRRCREVRRPIALSRRGLPSPPTAFRTEAECFVDGRVVVRVRAVLARPAPWRRLRGQYRGIYAGVAGRVIEAELAVRAQRGGRPLAFVRMSASGKTRLWSSYDCA